MNEGKPRRARGEGTIRERKREKNGKLQVVGFEARVSIGYDSKGKRVQRSLYGKTRGEVYDKLVKAQQSLNDGIALPKSAPASAFLTAWLATLRGRKASSTVSTYETTVRLHLAPCLRGQTLMSLLPDDLEKFYRELAKRNVGARTIAKAHATLRAALTYALKTGKVTRNVAAMIDPPAYQPEKKTVLDHEQARRFIAALVDHPGEALFVLALLTQIREGELLALTWGDIDLATRTVRISRTLQDDENGRPRISDRPKTDAGERFVLLPKVAVRILQRHKPRLARADALVFPSATGKPLSRQNVLQRWLYPVLDECICGHKPHAGRDTDATGAKIEPAEIARRPADAPKSCKACGCRQYRARLPRVTFHELRHTGATLLGDRHLAALQQRLGHSSSATTADIYLTLPVAAQKPLADRLDALFGGTNEGIRGQTRPKRGKKKPRKT